MNALVHQHALNIAHVVLARLLVQQMGAGQVRLIPLERQQPAQAAHVAEDRRSVGWRRWSRSASRSSVMSWLPMATMVFSIAAGNAATPPSPSRRRGGLRKSGESSRCRRP